MQRPYTNSKMLTKAGTSPGDHAQILCQIVEHAKNLAVEKITAMTETQNMGLRKSSIKVTHFTSTAQS